MGKLQKDTFSRRYKIKYRTIKKTNDRKKDEFERMVNDYLDQYQLSNDNSNQFSFDRMNATNHSVFKANVLNMAKEKDMISFTKNKTWWEALMINRRKRFNNSASKTISYTAPVSSDNINMGSQTHLGNGRHPIPTVVPSSNFSGIQNFPSDAGNYNYLRQSQAPLKTPTNNYGYVQIHPNPMQPPSFTASQVIMNIDQYTVQNSHQQTVQAEEILALKKDIQEKGAEIEQYKQRIVELATLIDQKDSIINTLQQQLNKNTDSNIVLQERERKHKRKLDTKDNKKRKGCRVRRTLEVAESSSSLSLSPINHVDESLRNPSSPQLQNTHDVATIPTSSETEKSNNKSLDSPSFSSTSSSSDSKEEQSDNNEEYCRGSNSYSFSSSELDSELNETPIIPAGIDESSYIEDSNASNTSSLSKPNENAPSSSSSSKSVFVKEGVADKSTDIFDASLVIMETKYNVPDKSTEILNTSDSNSKSVIILGTKLPSESVASVVSHQNESDASDESDQEEVVKVVVEAVRLLHNDKIYNDGCNVNLTTSSASGSVTISHSGESTIIDLENITQFYVSKENLKNSEVWLDADADVDEYIDKMSFFALEYEVKSLNKTHFVMMEPKENENLRELIAELENRGYGLEDLKFSDNTFEPYVNVFREDLKMQSSTEKENESILFHYPFKVDDTTIKTYTKDFPEAGGMIPEKSNGSLNWKEGQSDGALEKNNQGSSNTEPLCASDIERLKPRKYLNDVVINFWMKWYVLFVEYICFFYLKSLFY